MKQKPIYKYKVKKTLISWTDPETGRTYEHTRVRRVPVKVIGMRTWTRYATESVYY